MQWSVLGRAGWQHEYQSQIPRQVGSRRVACTSLGVLGADVRGVLSKEIVYKDTVV